ncbi:hypothetical protein BJF85_23850 [Saccharomonospora sp. CUA-673]|uniref:hypothetical protein n=1 Tax=Saccharomonospora sp. CUA-673 TaxID=1904969 RepID=UPI00095F625F|nr:hypothetical protein [Saccharomonospora sp. CUA-673]OLT41371.1 hypothetical protein BJF85_23850 [Saccharomonospora sp. CUA-673]
MQVLGVGVGDRAVDGGREGRRVGPQGAGHGHVGRQIASDRRWLRPVGQTGRSEHGGVRIGVGLAQHRPGVVPAQRLAHPLRGLHPVGAGVGVRQQHLDAHERTGTRRFHPGDLLPLEDGNGGAGVVAGGHVPGDDAGAGDGLDGANPHRTGHGAAYVTFGQIRGQCGPRRLFRELRGDHVLTRPSEQHSPAGPAFVPLVRQHHTLAVQPPVGRVDVRDAAHAPRSGLEGIPPSECLFQDPDHLVASAPTASRSPVRVPT